MFAIQSNDLYPLAGHNLIVSVLAMLFVVIFQLFLEPGVVADM